MGHRTPGYILSRLKLMARQKTRPHEPWWTQGAVDLVDRWITKDDVVVEFGSGRSTAWLAERAARVVSIEHHEGWHKKVSQDLAKYSNAEVRLIADDPEVYATAADDLDRVTLVVNDGRHRDACMRWALQRVAPGGGILLDDSERYLPFPTPFSKKSVPKCQRFEGWAELDPELAKWRPMTFSDGVSDTTLLVRA
ncbi:MAG: class I SAM-dependent methyltransferase [Phycisphaerales bacterium]